MAFLSDVPDRINDIKFDRATRLLRFETLSGIPGSVEGAGILTDGNELLFGCREVDLAIVCRTSGKHHIFSSDYLKSHGWPQTTIQASAYYGGLLILYDSSNSISYFNVSLDNETIEDFKGPIAKSSELTAISISNDYVCIAIDSHIEVFSQGTYQFLTKLLSKRICRYITIRGYEVVGLTEKPPDVYRWLLNEKNTSSDEDNASYPYTTREINHISRVKEIYHPCAKGFTVAVEEIEGCIVLFRSHVQSPKHFSWGITQMEGDIWKEMDLHIRIDQLCRYAVHLNYRESYKENLERRVPDLNIYKINEEGGVAFERACGLVGVSKIPEDLGLFLDLTIDGETIIFFFKSGIFLLPFTSSSEGTKEALLQERASSREVLLNGRFVDKLRRNSRSSNNSD